MDRGEWPGAIVSAKGTSENVPEQFCSLVVWKSDAGQTFVVAEGLECRQPKDVSLEKSAPASGHDASAREIPRSQASTL